MGWNILYQEAASLNTVVPAVYSLELISPRAVGSNPSTDVGSRTIPSGHRIFRAYPGIPYNIRAAVIGGSYPFVYSLDSVAAAAGMTINASTGEINWPNPTANLSPTITVRDSEGAVRSSQWTINVNTSDFRFVSPSGNDSNDGLTVSTPWRTLYKTRLSGQGKICYFRAGTYNVPELFSTSTYNSGLPGRPNHYSINVRHGDGASMQLLAYPGEEGQVIFDHGGIENPPNPGTLADRGVKIELVAESYSSTAYPFYLDGIWFRNVDNCWIRIQTNGSYHTIRRCKFSHLYEPEDGGNPGVMHVSSGTDYHQYMVYQDNVGTANQYNTGQSWVTGSGGVFKVYHCNKILIEGCEVDSGTLGDMKATSLRFEYRGNWIHDNSGTFGTSSGSRDQLGVYGNMNLSPAGTMTGEIRYNRITDRGSAYRTILQTQFDKGYGAMVCALNNDGLLGRTDVYRNTFVGKMTILSVGTGCGPFNIHNNVIVNNCSPANSPGYDNGVTYMYPASAPAVTVVGSGSNANLVGAIGDGIVDDTPVTGDLSLQGSYRSLWLGKKGHEVL